jgi:sulfate permease, SulP family
MNKTPNLLHRLSGCLPILHWLPGYQTAWFRADLTAGMTLAAFTIPEAIAFAELAGLPPQAGLYASIVAPLLYLIIGTSRQLVLGPTSAVSILIASALGSLTVDSPQQYAALAATTALLVGVMAFAAYALKLGFLVNFISESVLVGFSSGAALYIAATQFNKLAGVAGSEGQFIERIVHFFQHVGAWNPWAIFLGIVAIIILVIGEHRFPRLPWALMVVLGSIGLMSIGNVAQWTEIRVVGEIPQGLPTLGLPSIVLPDVRDMIRAAGAAFTLAYVEGMSMARTFATKNKYGVDANQELLALGFASVGAGLTQGYPVAGSFSRTALNDENGAQTQLASGIAAVLLALVVLFLAGLFTNLPEPILAAVVIVAVRGLFKWSALRHLYNLRRVEFWIALVAFGGVLVLGILDGVMIGALLSLVIVIGRASQPRMSILGRVPGQPQFSDLEENPQNLVIPGLHIVRADEGIFYANAEALRQQIVSLAGESDPPTQTIVLDMEMTSDLDVTGAAVLGELHRELKDRGVYLRLSRLQPSARELLDRAGISAEIGEENIHPRTLYAVAAYLTEEGHAQQIVCDILPDLVRCVQEIVSERASHQNGEERQRLDTINRKLEAILQELESSCDIS